LGRGVCASSQKAPGLGGFEDHIRDCEEGAFPQHQPQINVFKLHVAHPAMLDLHERNMCMFGTVSKGGREGGREGGRQPGRQAPGVKRLAATTHRAKAEGVVPRLLPHTCGEAI
jgi:hypothetical protein